MQLSSPDSDEIEITIFGRGIGECCARHLGENRWVIVDNFNHTDKSVDPITRAKTLIPVARWYLDELDVEPDRVETIFITHFHQGHCLADERTDALLVRRVGSEKHPQRDGFTPWEAGGVMRREWAWRWMVPMPAQRNRDCAAESPGTAARLHRDNSVMDEGFANHRNRSNRSAIKPAGATPPVASSAGCDTVTDVYPLAAQWSQLPH